MTLEYALERLDARRAVGSLGDEARCQQDGLTLPDGTVTLQRLEDRQKLSVVAEHGLEAREIAVDDSSIDRRLLFARSLRKLKPTLKIFQSLFL